MAAPRIFLSNSPSTAEVPIDWSLDERESHHLSKVLRLQSGADILALDGKGHIWQGRVVAADKRCMRVRLESLASYPPMQPERILVQALPKQKAWDTILRMAAEIGVSRIVPLFSHNSEIRFERERVESKLDKWRQVLIEACKQCGLPYLPSIDPPCSLEQWLKRQTLPLRGCIASLERGAPPLLHAGLTVDEPTAPVHAVVGPEGDFSAAEYALLRASGLSPVRLGQQTLRCDTAAAYTLSLLDQLLLEQ